MTLTTEQPYLGSTLLTLNGEGARKGALKIACSTPTCSGNRARGAHVTRGQNRKMKIGCWNVRTLLDFGRTDRPERRTAIVARELARLNLDIVALAETRFPDEGSLRENDGYTFFWKGRESGLPRLHGVGFAIRNSLVTQLSELPVGISERLMTLRIETGDNSFATFISAYAPTLDAEEQTKEAFYAELGSVITATPADDNLFILGDFNARVGRDHHLWRGSIGKEGIGKTNLNGILLLSKCAEHGLTITNTIFRQQNRLKGTWQHPRSKHWHMLDYVITRRKDIKNVYITRTAQASEYCWTDHRLVYSLIRLNIKSKRKDLNSTPRIKFNVEALNNPVIKECFQETLEQNIPAELPENIEDHWKILKSSIIDSCKSVIGTKKHKSQDWFDENNEEIGRLLEEVRKSLRDYLRHKTEEKRKVHRERKAEVQRVTRELKNNWWIEKSREMQRFIDRNDMNSFFATTKAIFGPSSQGLVPLKSKDGTRTLKSNTEILSRWREHFDELLNNNPTVDEDCLLEIPQHPITDSLGYVPTFAEVELAIKLMKNNKSPGPDCIPAEVYKQGGPFLARNLHSLIVKIWEEEVIASDLRDGLITTIYKKKGDKSDCGNHRGITLLSLAGKILAKIMNMRLTPIAEEVLPETQNGFRPSRGTADMIFCARQLQEKCREKQMPLFMAFVDLKKAFDSVKRELLWKIMAKAGCPEKFIKILRLLHDDMTATVIVNGESTAPFQVKSGVKQGCIIAPTMFSIFIAAVLDLAKDALPPGISITYRMDGGVFNLRRLRAPTKTSITSIVELQYADDNAVSALSEEELQQILNVFSQAYSRLGLEINASKTKVICQPPPGTQEALQPVFQLNGANLENVNDFAYLGSHLASNARIDAEIHYRLRCANASFGKLKNRVFNNRDLRPDTKILVYRTVVLTTLLYSSESWVTYRHHLKELEKFHQRSLRFILNISWESMRSNISVLEQAGCSSIEAMIIRNQLRWAGHVVRMKETALPKRIFYSDLTEGNRLVGRPLKRYKDLVKDNLKKCGIDAGTWEDEAHDRSSWRSKIYKGTETFEENRRQHIQHLKHARIERQENQARLELPRDNRCNECGRICGSRIGLISHLRSHR